MMDLAAQSYNFSPYHHAMNPMNGMGSAMGAAMNPMAGFMMNSHHHPGAAQYSHKDLANGMALPPRGIVDYYHSCKSKCHLV